MLLDELGQYRPELLDRPRVRVGSRPIWRADATVAAFDGPVVSAVTGCRRPRVLGALRVEVEARP